MWFGRSSFVERQVVAAKLFRISREDIECLPGKLIEVGLILLVVSSHQPLFEKVIEFASQLGDRFVNVIGPDGNGVFFDFGLKIHVVRMSNDYA